MMDNTFYFLISIGILFIILLIILFAILSRKHDKKTLNQIELPKRYVSCLSDEDDYASMENVTDNEAMDNDMENNRN